MPDEMHEEMLPLFGDEVYLPCRVERDGTFEAQCPLTGSWVGFGLKGDQFLLKTGSQSRHKEWLPARVFFPAEVGHAVYCRVRVADLLNRDASQFYLPFLPDGPWFMKELLSVKYRRYCEEKANV